MKAVTLAVIFGILGFAGLIVLLMWVGAKNSEARLRNQFTAQQAANESSFDKTWKIIQQDAGVANQERASFAEAYTEIMNATKGVAGEGKLASFFTQAKIDISPDLFAKLMTVIESQRESFHRDQLKLLEIVKQHDDLRTTMPSSFFVGNVDPLVAKLVTSSKTDEAFTTGKDDDVELFKKSGERNN